MAKRQKKKHGSSKRRRSAKRAYRGSALSRYNKSPKFKAKRAAAARKAARTRKRNKNKHASYAKKKGGKKRRGGGKKRRGGGKKRRGGGKKRRGGGKRGKHWRRARAQGLARRRRMSREQIQAARLARRKGKGKAGAVVVVASPGSLSPHQQSYLAKKRAELAARAEAARTKLPSWWAA